MESINKKEQSQTSSTQAETIDERPDQIAWTDELEAMMKKWGEEAKGLNWMHTKCAKWFNYWDKIIGLPAGVLGVVLGMAIFATNDTCSPSTTDLALKIVFGSISAIAGALVFIQNYLGYAKRSAQHTEAAVQYLVFSVDIEAELTLDRNSRQPAKKFFKQMKHKQASLTLSKYPDIIQRYTEEYKLLLFNSTVARPVAADNITAIEVNKHQGTSEETKNPSGHDPVMTVMIDKILEEERKNAAIQYEMTRFAQRNKGKEREKN